LTETSPVACFNHVGRTPRPGTIGTPVWGVEVEIADPAYLDEIRLLPRGEIGELVVRGHNLFAGYLNRPEATAEAMVDGWFRTGDIGELDEDGFLKITGRKKEIIVTASGKNVIPAMLEDQIRADALVSQCVVVGEGRPFISALVTLDPEAVPGWLERHHLDKNLSMDELSTHPEVLQAIQKIIDKANTSVSRAESIRAFRVVSEDFTESSGHLTPSMKIKRAVVLSDYDALIEDIYSAPKPVA